MEGYEGLVREYAHFSPVGNIAASMCDLWSNESVQQVPLLSGSAPEAFAQVLVYDCRLMNEALPKGTRRTCATCWCRLTCTGAPRL